MAPYFYGPLFDGPQLPLGGPSVRPSVTKRISELLARIVPKVEQEVGWPSTPGRFFRNFDFGDFGNLAGAFWSKLVDLGRFSTLNVIFSKTVQ